ncbi:MAG: polysaccharide deacetylase family protein [Fusobacteriaceae bacterium]
MILNLNKKYSIPILMYHQFVNKKNEGGKIKLFVTKKTLELHLIILKFLGYITITFDDLEKLNLKGKSNKKYIILTVDDGYVDNYEILFPLLKKYNMKAVIYMITGVTYNKWTHENMGENKFYLLNRTQIKEMSESGLVEFGGHTLTHPSMLEISSEEIKHEVATNKNNLEEITGKRIISFAYPYGHLSERIKNIIVECGYKFAVSTDTGTGIIEDDFYDIRRTAIDKTSLVDFFRKISSGYLQYKYKKYGNKKFEDKFDKNKI